MIRQLAFTVLMSLVIIGCSTSKVITLTPHTDLALLPEYDNYEKIRKKYTVTKEVNFGKDPEERRKSLLLAKENINYEVPDRKVVFKAMLWDLPLIKAFLVHQNFHPNSPAGEELKFRLLQEHRKFTKITLSADSHVNRYFSTKDWNIWLVDRFGRTYLPPKTKEISEEEMMLPSNTTVLGRRTESPGYMVYHDNSTLYFDRLDLPRLSPVSLVLSKKEDNRKVKLTFKVKGTSPEFPHEHSDHSGSTLHTMETSTHTLAEPEPMTEIDRIEMMRLHFAQGTAHYKNGAFEVAIEEWNKVLELDPDHEISKAKIKKAEARLAELKGEEEEYSDKQIQRQMQIHFLMASEYYKAGDYEAAIEEWERVLEYEPDHEPSLIKIQRAEQKLVDQHYQ